MIDLDRYPVFVTEPNSAWHAKHPLPPNPTLDQRIAWHLEHARRCPCPAEDGDILEELWKRYRGKHQDFWIEHNCNDHRVLGAWAADSAERLLPFFEEHNRDDPRPREAIRVLREWVETGEFHMAVIRKASLGAHAAAKLVAKEDQAASFAAHAAGQAVGTAHVPTHALGVVVYSMKLAVFTHPSDARAALAEELEWQMQHLPDSLKPWVETWIQKLAL